MKNRTQSFTSTSFDSENAVGRSPQISSRHRTVGQKSAAAGSLSADEAGRGLLELCQEIAGTLIRRYLVSDSAAAVRIRTVDDLKARLTCTDHQAQALVTLALEVIHVKSYGKYRCSPERLEKLIAQAGGVVSRS